MPELHRRAGEWCERNGFEAEAVDHALAAGDLDWAARLVERTAWTMLAWGELSTLQRWLEALPNELVRAWPQFCIYHAWTLVQSGQLDAGALRLKDAERGLDASDSSNVKGLAEVRGLQGEVAVIRAYDAVLRRDVARTLEFSRQALEKLSKDNFSMRGAAALNLAAAYWMSGDIAAASSAYAEAIDLAQPTGNVYLALRAFTQLGKMQAVNGRLREAADTCREALQLASQHGGRSLPIAGLANVGLAKVLHKWNDLEGATNHAIEGIKLGKQGGHLETLLDGYLTLMRVMQARGNTDEATSSIQKAEQLVRSHNLPNGIAQIKAYRARLWLMQGRLEKTARWVRESGVAADDEVSHMREFEYITLARVLIAQGRHDEAIGLLKKLQDTAQEMGRVGYIIETMMLRALATEAQGGTAQALTVLAEALSLAEPGGYIRVFVDEGAPLAALISKLPEAYKKGHQPGPRPSPEYVSKVQAALGWRGASAAYASAQRQPRSGQPQHEPLSERELEVLRLIASGMSNEAIAQTLVITVSTVKTHIVNVYGKLNVRSRTQAVALARELALLR